jgi:hypothetical protein
MKTKTKKYTLANGVCDAVRKQFFTTYNLELMNEIRRIKLNEIKCTTTEQR